MENEQRCDIAIKYALTSLTHVISEVKRHPDSADKATLLETIRKRNADLLAALLRLGKDEIEAQNIVDAVLSEADDAADKMLKEVTQEALGQNPQAQETINFIRQALRRENVG